MIFLLTALCWFIIATFFLNDVLEFGVAFYLGEMIYFIVLFIFYIVPSILYFLKEKIFDVTCVK